MMNVLEMKWPSLLVVVNTNDFNDIFLSAIQMVCCETDSIQTNQSELRIDEM